MNIIIVVAKRDRKRHEGAIARFNEWRRRADQPHERPDHVLIAEFGQGLQGYRADMIIMLDYPKDELDVAWFNEALKTRLVMGGIFLDMN